MSDRQTVPMTPELRERWQRAVRETEAELPELLDMGERLREAACEKPSQGICGKPFIAAGAVWRPLPSRPASRSKTSICF
jgi:hypothetical protein